MCRACPEHGLRGLRRFASRPKGTKQHRIIITIITTYIHNILIIVITIITVIELSENFQRFIGGGVGLAKCCLVQVKHPGLPKQRRTKFADL